MLAHLEAKLGIERQRAHVIARLHQANSGEAPGLRAVHDRAHQLTADALVLNLGIDRDRPDARDGIALVEEVAAGDFPVMLGHHAMESRIAQHSANYAGGDFGVGKIRRKIVRVRDRGESGMADAPKLRRIVRMSRPNCDGHRTSPACCVAGSYRLATLLATKRTMSLLVIAPCTLHDPGKWSA